MKTVMIYNNETYNIVAYIFTKRDVMYICTGNFFKVTLDDGKFFIFDKRKYSYSILMESGEKADER